MASLKHCQLCDEFTSTTLSELVRHLSLVHAHLAGFHLRCGLNGCQKAFRNILTYCNHIYAFHTDSHVSEPHVSEPSQTNSDGGWVSDLDDGELDQPLNLQPSEPTPLDPSELKKAAATWILKVKEGHKLPQSTINSVFNDFIEFNCLLLQDLHSVVIQKNRSAGLDPDTVSGLSEVFDSNSLYGKPFQGLETQYLQQKYLRENFSMVVSRILVFFF